MKNLGENLYDGIPDIIENTIVMSNANSSIVIHKGTYVLKNDKHEIIIDGIIKFNWLPNPCINFYGTPKTNLVQIGYAFNTFESSDLILDGLLFGKAELVEVNFDGNTQIKGIINGQGIKGDNSIPVEKLRFSIPNLRDFHGTTVKRVSNDNISAHNSRITLENDNLIIKIDKCHNYKILQESLISNGGYIIQYSGELISKKGPIIYNEIKETFQCINTFLSFLNGRRTAAIFFHGIYEDEIKWCDYSNYMLDPYKSVPSWPQMNSIAGLNELWQKFCDLWKDSDDEYFLISAIHWYIEANNNSGFVEGSIIMAQTALELLYNWLLVENKKIIIGKDTENINAANKIRLLLSQLNIDYEVPTTFSYLQSYINENKLYDGPEAIVQIRNAIVHSQEEKRKKLSSIDIRARYGALQLSIWYIEMSLLYILNFDEKYFYRCNNFFQISDQQKTVPWSKKKNEI